MRRPLLTGILPALLAAGAVLAGTLLSQERSRAGAAPYPFPRARDAGPEKEIAALEERARRRPDDGLDLALLASAYAAQARRTHHAAEFVRAEKTALRSLEKLPFHNEGATMVLARVAEARHDFVRAIGLAREVLRSKPSSTDARGLLLTSFLATGRLEEAMEIADDLVDRSPQQGSFALRAVALATTGRDAEAQRSFERALAVEDVGELDESARTRAMLARFHLRRGRSAPARELLEESLRLLPGFPMAHALMAELLESTGDLDGAARHAALAAADSHDPMHQVLLARLTRNESLYGEAERQIRSELKEGGFGHRLALVHLLLQRGRPEDRAEALRLAREESTVRRSPEALDALAWAHLALGQTLEARKAVLEALRRGAREPFLLRRAEEAKVSY